MILHHLTNDFANPLTHSWVVDTLSLTLARITISDDLRLTVEAVKPTDHDAPNVSQDLEPFSPTKIAARILKNLRQHINPSIRPHRISMLDQNSENIPEYLDFYELDGDGISIMHMTEPVFIAEYDGKNWIKPGPFRIRIDISVEGWAYFFTEAYEELEKLNALR